MSKKKTLPVVSSDIAESLIRVQKDGGDWSAYHYAIEQVGEAKFLELLLDEATRVLMPIDKAADAMLNKQAIMNNPPTAQLVLASADGAEIVVDTLMMVPVATANGKSVKRPIDKVTAEEYLTWTIQRDGVAAAQKTMSAKRREDAQAIYDSLNPSERQELLGDVFPELKNQLNQADDAGELEA
ncbi:MAG: hypothetical protein EBR82_58740 [Caulobacteraceae bacterium]|nr:hypothetical protein [Caulobacteraceae bacterium]